MNNNFNGETQIIQVMEETLHVYIFNNYIEIKKLLLMYMIIIKKNYFLDGGCEYYIKNLI